MVKKIFIIFLIISTIIKTTSSTDLQLAVNGECMIGYFMCTNTTYCLPQKNNCDGIGDCPNGSDEYDCDDYGDDDFWDHFVRKRPAAEHDDHPEFCVLNYTGNCTCRYRDLLCVHRHLTTIAEQFPDVDVDLLDFHDNNFKQITEEMIRKLPKNIEKLSLAHCQIEILEKNAFYHQNIYSIHLDNNYLTRFPSKLFASENNLTSLYMMYNKLEIIEFGAFDELENLIELDLRGNALYSIDGKILEPLKNLRYLYLQENQLKTIEQNTFPSLKHLNRLSLVKNQLDYIPPFCFTSLPSLQDLYLSDNHLKKLVTGTFSNLTQLRVLTLNDNEIETIDVTTFIDIPNLISLRLEHNNFRILDENVLKPLEKLPYIYFDRFEMCTFAKHVRVCYPNGDGISSREHLLDNIVLRSSVWIMAMVGFIGNLTVLFGRLITRTNNVVHSLYLRNLALSDLLMALYLFIIAMTDMRYRGVYLDYQYEWRHGPICSFCGFLSTLSSESSVFILSLVTWDRFISVTRPLARKQVSNRTATITLIIIWFISIGLSFAPISHLLNIYFGDEFYGNNGVCLSLHIHEPYAKGWIYSTILFVLLNALALFFIIYAYIRMMHAIKISGIGCRSTRNNQERDGITKRFAIIITTDCLCWVPIIIVKLVAFGTPIPPTLYAWLAIFILPINSALNPVLYTLTTSLFKIQARKLLQHLCIRRKKIENSGSESGFSLSLIGSGRRIFNQRGTQSTGVGSGQGMTWKRSTAV